MPSVQGRRRQRAGVAVRAARGGQQPLQVDGRLHTRHLAGAVRERLGKEPELGVLTTHAHERAEHRPFAVDRLMDEVDLERLHGSGDWMLSRRVEMELDE
jgi:hypothetical protein